MSKMKTIRACFLALPLLFVAACGSENIPSPPAITPESIVAADPAQLSDSELCLYSQAADDWIVWLDSWAAFVSDIFDREFDLDETLNALTEQNAALKQVAQVRDICN